MWEKDYLCYEDETTQRVTRIFVGEDRVYAAGVKVTYQIDNGYALERTVTDREDTIAAAPPAALEGYTFVGGGGRMTWRKRRCFRNISSVRRNQSRSMQCIKSRWPLGWCQTVALWQKPGQRRVSPHSVTTTTGIPRASLPQSRHAKKKKKYVLLRVQCRIFFQSNPSFRGVVAYLCFGGIARGKIKKLENRL